MNRLAVGLAVLSLLAMSAASAHAKIRWAQIDGTSSGTAAGQCNEPPDQPAYDKQCPSGNCECVQVPNATVSNIAGKPSLAGTGTANLFLTFDTGAAMPTGVGNCTPFFGIAELNTMRGSTQVAETLNLVGIHCDPVDDPAHEPVLGGFGVSKNPTPSPPAKGFGKIKGSFDLATTGKVSLTLHGPIKK